MKYTLNEKEYNIYKSASKQYDEGFKDGIEEGSSNIRAKVIFGCGVLGLIIGFFIGVAGVAMGNT